MTDDSWNLSILALNVSRPPKARAVALLTWLAERDEDVFVLTEIGSGDGSAWLAATFSATGFSVVGDLPRARDLGVLIVGRGIELRRDETAPPAPLPGRIEAAVLPPAPDGCITPDGRALRLAGVYGVASDPVRYASSTQRQRKRAWLSAYDAWLSDWPATTEPALVIGDLNIVDPVYDDRLPYVLPEEVQAYAGHSSRHGLVDLWRARNPDAVEVSWVDHSGAGCRYDHAFGTPELMTHVTDCGLVDEPRTRGLSDHAALTLTLEGPTP